MKNLKLIAFGIILLVSSTSNAQISINLNIGNTPAPRYHNNVNLAVSYYYLPDIETYFDARANVYVYLERGNWTRSRNLPYRYRDYDARNCYRVALNDYHGNRPYNNFYNDRSRYYVGYRGESHRVVENRHNNHGHYNKNKSKSWKNNRYVSNNHHDNRRNKYDHKYNNRY